MKKEKDDNNYIEQWIALFEKAQKLLTPERFKVWIYGVGVEGTYEERCRVGKAILEMLIPSHYAYQIRMTTNNNMVVSKVLHEVSTAMREAIGP